MDYHYTIYYLYHHHNPGTIHPLPAPTKTEGRTSQVLSWFLLSHDYYYYGACNLCSADGVPFLCRRRFVFVAAAVSADCTSTNDLGVMHQHPLWHVWPHILEQSSPTVYSNGKVQERSGRTGNNWQRWRRRKKERTVRHLFFQRIFIITYADRSLCVHLESSLYKAFESAFKVKAIPRILIRISSLKFYYYQNDKNVIRYYSIILKIYFGNESQ